MKISGPPKGPPIPPPDLNERAVDQPREAERNRFGQVLGQEAAQGPTATSAAPPQHESLAGIARSKDVQAIIAQVRSGAIDREQATRMLVDVVVAKRGKSLPAPQQQQLQQLLLRVANEDPFITAQLKRLRAED